MLLKYIVSFLCVYVCVHSALVSVCFIHISMFLCKQVLCLEKEVTSSQPSSVRVRHSSQNNSCMTTQLQTATSTSNPTVIQPSQNPSCTFAPDTPQGKRGSDGSLVWLAEAGRSVSSLEISSSHKHQSHRDSTPSLTSDISLPSATLELQQRLQQLQKWVYIHCFTMCGSRLGFAFFLSVQLNFVRSHTGDFVCVCVWETLKAKTAKSETQAVPSAVWTAQWTTRHGWLDSTEQIGLCWATQTNLSSETVGSVTWPICICRWFPVTNHGIHVCSDNWNY